MLIAYNGFFFFFNLTLTETSAINAMELFTLGFKEQTIL